MATDTPDLPPTLPALIRQEVHDLKANWGWFLALGILLIVAGTAAIGLAVLTTVLAVLTIGVLALMASGAEIASAVWSRKWEGTLVHILIGVLYGVFGFLLITKPEKAAAALTLIMAAVFLVGGFFRIALAFTLQFHHWGWAVFGGAVSVLLGLLIWQDWPDSAAWVIGLFVGIDLLVTGWTWVILALGLRGLPDPRRPAGE